LLAARDMLANLQSAVQAEELKRRQLELADPTDSQKIAESGLKLAEAKLQQAEDYLAKHTVSAPTDGIALRVNVSAGQVIGPAAGLPAIWFAPDKPRIVRAEIDQAFAHRVQPGQRAQLFDDRLEGEHWTGVVTRCGEWIAQRRSTLDEPFERNDVRTLECLIAIDAGQPEVRIGQRMRVVLVGPMESAAGTGELRP
jgi:multidrug resistance efflux pump